MALEDAAEEDGVGIADGKGHGVGVAEDTIFRLASMTKAITSATALTIWERERLPLGAPVTRWLPWFRPPLPEGMRPEVTARHLMAHTAGLSADAFDASGDYRGPGI